MADPDTSIGGGHSQFPPTAWDLLERLRDPRDPRAQADLSRMIEVYWRPVYRFVRLAWKRSNEDAKDLTQAFFIHLMEGDLLARASPEKGNFRKVLLTTLRNFLANDVRAAKAIKRGGGRFQVSLDADADEGWAADEEAAPETAFDAQWARTLLDRAIETLKERSRPEVFAAFRRFHIDDQPARQIAAELGVSESQVGHFLGQARTDLRRIVTDAIREYVRDEAELQEELETLFRGWR